MGGRGGEEGGVKAVLDWLEGANFFPTINRGGHDFLGFARGLVCAFANGITFKKLISKMQVVKMDNPVRRILSKTSLL